MSLEEALTSAIKLAVEAHKYQEDKKGDPYILHPLNVMLIVGQYGETQDEKNLYRIIAVLHDVVEDTGYTFDNLYWRLDRYLSLDDLITVMRALTVLTHEKDVSYEDYIRDVATNPIAVKVKRADIQHNLSPARLLHLPESDQQRLKKKYGNALNIMFEMVQED